MTTVNEVPHDLDVAGAKGELVLFIGAGASAPPPSRLPMFDALAESVAIDVGMDIRSAVSPEVLLGKIDERVGNVHSRVAEKIVASKRSNPVHRSLVRIANSTGFRIVTTNFDTHLERAARRLGYPHATYRAPALPQGDSFSGLVHLHGSVPWDEHHRITVTDRDFGEAYMVRRWATHFLTSLFEKNVVVFVGYSGQDTLIRYLTRALPPHPRAFALCVEPEVESWLELGVEPLIYGADGEFEKLPHLLDGWATRLGEDSLAKRANIHAIADRGPEADGAAEGLARVLSNDELARYFVEVADARSWIASKTCGTAIEGALASGEPSTVLNFFATWAATLASTDEGVEVLLGLAAREKFGPGVWRSVWGEVFRTGQTEKRSPKLASLLVATQPPGTEDLVLGLAENVAATDPDAAVTYFGSQLRLRRRVTKSIWSFRHDHQLEFATNADPYHLNSAWESVGPRLGARGPVVLDLLLATLEMASAEIATFSGYSGPDRVSLAANTLIEDDEDESRDSLALMVRIARDLVNTEVSTSGVATIERLFRRDSLVSQRLALSAAAKVDVDADWLLEQVVSRDMLFKFGAKPELFAAIRRAYPIASASARAAFLEHATIASTPDGAGPREYEVFNLLVWLNRTMPEDRGTSAALESMRGAHPDFGERERPDLDMSSTTWSVVDPYEATGSFERLSAREIADQAPANDDRDHEAWVGELRNASHTRPELPVEVMAEFASREAWGANAWSSLIAVVRSLDEDDADRSDRALAEVLAHPALGSLAWAIRGWIDSDASITPERDERHFGPLVERARRAWHAMPVDASTAEPQSIEKALLSPRGAMAAAYMTSLSAYVSVTGGPVLDEHWTHIEMMLETSSDVLDGSAAVVCRDMSWILASNPQLFAARIAPLLVADPGSVWQAWAGLLSRPIGLSALWPHISDSLRYVFPYIRAKAPDLLAQFYSVHALHFLLGRGQPDSWVDAMLANATEEQASEWVDSTRRLLQRDPDPGAIERLLRLWKRMLSGAPRPVTPAIAVEFRKLIAFLPLAFERAAELYIAGPPPSSDRYTYSMISPGDFGNSAPRTLVLRVVAHDLTSREIPPLDSTSVHQFAKESLDVDEAAARAVLNQLLRLGVMPAAVTLEQAG